jgi:hypothetical protein
MNQVANLEDLRETCEYTIQSAIDFPSFDLINNEVLVPMDDGGRVRFVEMESAT